MEIREAQICDAKSIARVHVDSWRSTYKGVISADYLDNITYDDREKMWLKLLDPEKKPKQSFIYVACEGENIIGFVSGGLSRDKVANLEGEIVGIYIIEKYQGIGLGKRLMSVGVDRFIEEGINSMIIWVLDGNAHATKFYEHMGGIRVAEQEVKIGTCEHTIIGYGWVSIDGLTAS